MDPIEGLRRAVLAACTLTCWARLGAEDADTGVQVPQEPPAVATARPREPSPIQIDLYSPINDLERRLDYAIDGVFSSRYRLRTSPGERDQDLYQNLHLSLGKPEQNRVSGVFLGRLSEDIDGQSDRTGFSLFDGITDTYDSNVNGRFYLGYVDLRRFELLDVIGLDRVRAGRQSYDETADTLIFDGGRLDTRPFEALANLRLTVYGGLPVHYFESSPSGDVVAGAGLELAPFRRTRARVDWTYLEDRRDREDIHARDHLLSAAIWQSLGDRVNLHGRYNLLDGDTRDYLLRGTYREDLIDMLFQASFHHVVKTLRDLSVELDPFFSVMREYRPFWQVDLRASKGLGRYAVIDAGVDLRELTHEEDEGTFNHEFIRYYVLPSTRDWPFPGTSLSLTGELWDSQDDEYFTLGGEVRQTVLLALTFAAGTYYSLYKFDFFAEREKTHVRTLFGRVEYKLASDLRLHALYEYEKDDRTTYHTVEAGLTYSF